MVTRTVKTFPPRLVVLNTRLAGTELLIFAAEALIGRTEDNDISIEHTSISRHHARIKLLDGLTMIEDLKSANGILVNGIEVTRATLSSGDVVELGKVKLRFVAEGEKFKLGKAEIEQAQIEAAMAEANTKS